MQCERFERRLQQLLDRRLCPEQDKALLRHAARCSTCRLWLSAQRRLWEGWRRSCPPEPDRGFAQRVLARTSRSKAAAAPLGPGAWALAAAAMLLVMTAPGQWVHIRKQQTHSPIPAARTPAAATMAGDAPVRHARETQSPVPGETQPAGCLATDTQLIREVWNTCLRHLADPPIDGLKPVEHITWSFKPLASTLSAALDALRSTMPMGQDSVPAEPRAQTSALLPGWAIS